MVFVSKIGIDRFSAADGHIGCCSSFCSRGDAVIINVQTMLSRHVTKRVTQTDDRALSPLKEYDLFTMSDWPDNSIYDTDNRRKDDIYERTLF